MVFPLRIMNRRSTNREKGTYRLARDDWKYYDEEMEEGEEEEAGKPPPLEKQCRNCLHWVPREAPTCSWCGKPFDDDGGRPE